MHMQNSEDSLKAFEKYPPELQEIIAAAEDGKGEDWKFIDERLPNIVKHESAIRWARKEGIGHKTNENFRDLAASMFELYEGHLTADDHHHLKNVMERDHKKPAGFRAACALLKHGERVVQVKAKQVLERFSHHNDPVISRHAQELLAQKTEKKEG